MNIRWIAERAHTIALAGLVGVPTLFTAFAVLPELAIPIPSNNDDATHFLLIQRASDALARGENILEFWVPQVELGFPWLVYYQPVPALVVVFLHRALFGLVELISVFNLVRYVLLVGFPLTVFWSLRRMGVAPAGAAVAAAVSPLFSGNFRYGFEYDSYVWRGFGMFTQLAAMHLSFVTLALAWDALRTRGRRELAWAAIAFSVLVPTHLLYAYMMAISLGGLALAGAESARDALRRVLRLAVIGTSAVLVNAWLWVPFFMHTAYAGLSPYLQKEKFDSYGAATILPWLLSGELLDHGRLPVITAMLGVGVVAAAMDRSPLARGALALFLTWLILYFGRPTLGDLVSLLPMSHGLLIHRFIGSVELFAVVLIGIGAAWVFHRVRASETPLRFAGAAGLALVLLLPALGERAAFYALNTTWMRQTADAISSDVDARTILSAIRELPPGRVFAGLRSSGFGQDLDFGIPFNSVRFSDALIFNGIPVVASPYSSASLNADLMWDFAIQRPEHYQLFNIRYVVAPTNAEMPAFLRPITRTSRYTLYLAPTTGYAKYGEVNERLGVRTQTGLFSLNRPWFNGPDVGVRFHRFDYPAPADAASPAPSAGCSRPTYAYERVRPDALEVLVGCPEPSTLVLKLTYHPNWRVLVDGRAAEAFMVSPSFIGVALEPGDHFVTAEYRASPVKTPLFILTILAALGALAFVSRRRLASLWTRGRRWSQTSGVGRRLLLR